MSLKYDEIRGLLSRSMIMVRDFLLEEVYHDSTDEQLAQEWETTVTKVKNLKSDRIILHELLEMLNYTELDFGMAIRDPSTGKEITFYAANNLASDNDYDSQTEEITQYGSDKKGVDPLDDEDAGLDGIPTTYSILYDANGNVISRDGTVVVDGDFELDDPDEDFDEEGEEDEFDHDEEENEAHYKKPHPGDEEEAGDWIPTRKVPRSQGTQPCGVRIGPRMPVDDPMSKYAPEVRAFFDFSEDEMSDDLDGEDEEFDVVAAIGEDVIEAEYHELGRRDLEELIGSHPDELCENCMAHARLIDSMLCHYCTTAGVICNPPENSIEQREIDGHELMAVVNQQAQAAKEKSKRLLEAACMLSEEE